mmetsp:Transcript_14969/g.23713  ORF Transcript_14969/g.23713 Transcript_14969/m.23713 type:complete len:84 (+) Transcript_14969:410-661(+)
MRPVSSLRVRLPNEVSTYSPAVSEREDSFLSPRPAKDLALRPRRRRGVHGLKAILGSRAIRYTFHFEQKGGSIETPLRFSHIF